MTSFPSIRVEGGLLAPDTLDQLLAGELPGQRPADFGLDGRRNLTDEIAAAFTDARALWGVFQHRLQRLPEKDLATSVTRDAWVIPFLGLLGYELRYNQSGYQVDGQTFAISHRAGESAEAPPVHVVGAGQKLGRVPESGRPRLAPHSLVQEYLNRTEHLWGVVTNGLTLRVLRNSTFIRRQPYVEFDIQAMIEEQRFYDFAGFYRLLHRTRLPRGIADARDSLVEKYYAASEEQGGRVREHLRDGVEECITILGNGFLSHADNDNLRWRVSSACTGNERIGPDDLYRQLLRLVYRLLFLLVSEDRGLISADPIYREDYGIARLRHLLDHRSAFTDDGDIWQSLRVLWKILSDEELAAILGVAPLNGELFAEEPIDNCALSNRDLLQAFWRLAWYREKGPVARRVNYAALDVEELGSVYESLLEFRPHIQASGNNPRFELLSEGHERRSTGSHYTPPALVAPLIQHALDPVLEGRLRATVSREDKIRAILSMKVCDLACGSGHFLLAAARRLGKELARTRTGEEEPAPEHMREAVRDVITHSIYGVDKNPLAVELCRVALWLEGHAENKPLTFLDRRIRCGDTLVGVFDLAVLERGIPDQAYRPIAGDDTKVARGAKKLNAAERMEALFQYPALEKLREFAHELRKMDDLREDTIEQVRAKAEAYRRAEGTPDFNRLRIACNIWTAAFFQSYSSQAVAAISTDTLRTALSVGTLSDRRTGAWVETEARGRNFFHWPLAFPEVFATGGFDVLIGNPPFMGGLKISEKFGDKYRDWLEKTFTEFAGKADICAAFIRRAFESLRPGGSLGMIATNTVGQGDTREAGLAMVVRQGGTITFCQRFVKWIGKANVEVDLVATAKGNSSRPRVLDGQVVERISSRLDSDPEHEPATLRQNQHKSFQGSIVLGMGFVLSKEEAETLIGKEPRNADCLYPYLTGEDLNNDPEQRPSRWVIQFGERSEQEARAYTDLWAIVYDRVRLERIRKDAHKYPRMVNEWWKHWNNRQELYRSITALRRVLVRSRVSETHMIAFAPTNIIFADVVVAFAFDDYYHFTLLQSNIHEQWVRRTASTMRTDIRYTPTDCFETFPFPIDPSAETMERAAQVGMEYDRKRTQILTSMRMGLTRVYNQFNNPSCSDPAITALRGLHVELDQTIVACYGWRGTELDHGFHRNERGQTRFSISPAASQNVFGRLLELNRSYPARIG
jgi:hypothetical protein